jgi:cytochrome c556
MRRVVVFVAAALALAGGVRCADEAMDEDLMQSIEDTNKSLSSNLAVKDDRGSKEDAKELIDMFSKVEGYFAAKGNATDAVDLARKSKQLTLDIINSVSAEDFDTAMNASTTLSRACKTCHRSYKKDKDKDKEKS